MDKQQRGLLLVAQEEAQAQIKQLTDKLKAFGQEVSRFAQSLSSQTERVVFKDAPDGLSAYPSDVVIGNAPFAWDKIPSKESIAELILELKRQQQSLKDVQLQLQQK